MVLEVQYRLSAEDCPQRSPSVYNPQPATHNSAQALKSSDSGLRNRSISQRREGTYAILVDGPIKGGRVCDHGDYPCW